jgi:hypothetical protein
MAETPQVCRWLRQCLWLVNDPSKSAGRASGTPLSVLLLPAIGFLLAMPPASRAAADTDPAAPPVTSDTAVKSGGDALRDNGFPWYDAEHDTLRPVVLQRFKDDGKNDTDDESSTLKRHHDLLREGRSGNGKWGNGHSGNGTSDGDDEPSSPNISFPAINAAWLIWVVWILIGGVLAFLAAMLIRAFLNREARKAQSSAGESVEAEEDRNYLDALPLPAARRKGGLLDEARQCYEAGDYNTAIVYLYSYELLKLDQNQWIRLAKGKTNREYLRELSARGELQGVLSRTMVPFEDVFFGDHPLDRARFEVCWNEVERFNRLVERAST